MLTWQPESVGGLEGRVDPEQSEFDWEIRHRCRRLMRGTVAA